MQEMKLDPHLTPLRAAAAATRMIAADDGAWVVAELAGRWLAEEFTEHQEAPPVLALIDARRDARVATASGWLLGRPGAEGALYLTNDGAELTYRLSWLVPPDDLEIEGIPIGQSQRRPYVSDAVIFIIQAVADIFRGAEVACNGSST